MKLQENMNQEDIKKELSKHNVDKKYKKIKLAELALEDNILYRITHNAYASNIDSGIIRTSCYAPGTLLANRGAWGCKSYLKQVSKICLLARHEKKC